MERIRLSRPDAAFYAFFSVDGVDDDLAFAQNLVRNQRVGLAPGTAFGPSGEGYVRLSACGDRANVETAVQRIKEKWGK